MKQGKFHLVASESMFWTQAFGMFWDQVAVKIKKHPPKWGLFFNKRRVCLQTYWIGRSRSYGRTAFQAFALDQETWGIQNKLFLASGVEGFPDDILPSGKMGTFLPVTSLKKLSRDSSEWNFPSTKKHVGVFSTDPPQNKTKQSCPLYVHWKGSSYLKYWL